MKKRVYLKYSFFLLMYFYVNQIKGQHNFLGENQEFIVNHFKEDPEYSVNLDSVNDFTILITCKTFEQYPYYTYEIDIQRDVCISYALVSKDRQILDTYIDILDHLGEIIERDSSFQNFTYKVEGIDKNSYYSIKQPYVNSTYYSRRNIFYVLITEELKIESDK